MLEIVNKVSKRGVMMHYEKVVVYYTASWCRPCVEIATPLMERLSARCDRVKFIKIDVGAYQGPDEGISVVPTFRFYNKRKLVNEVRGADTRLIENAVNALALSHGRC